MPPPRKARPVRSCTECKQVKLRCDAKQTSPRPCTRCLSKGFECVVDSSFRRTPARRRLDELSQEVNHLRRSLQDAAHQRLSAEPQVPRHGDTETVRCSSSWGTEQSLADVEDDQIGDCAFTRDELISIFSTFAVSFYKHLPVVDPPITPRLLQKSSPFLFWTIVMIVVHRAPLAYPEVRSSALSNAYKPLLAKAVLATPLTLSTIQALLYLCTWPFSVDYQARDQSWTLVGIAVNAALYSGLHKPNHPQSLRSIGVFVDSRTRSSLWLACFYVSANLSQSIGVPPYIRSPEDLAVVSRIASDESVPRELAVLAEIQVCAVKYTSLVSESAELHLAAMLERAFKHELDLTKDRFAAHWSADIEFVFLDAKLHLIATLAVSHSNKQLNSTSEGSSGLPVDPSLAVALSDGFDCAIRLIRILCLGQDVSQAPIPLGKHAITVDELFAEGLPKLYFRGLVFAAFYLLRYRISSNTTLTAAGHLARKHVDIACNYLRRHSMRPTDEPGRAAAAIETLHRFSTVLPAAISGPMRIKERLGASIFYDALTKANEFRSRPVWVLNDQEQPQQKLVVETTPSNIAGQADTPATDTGERGAELSAGNGGYLADLPEDWLEHLDLDVMELSGDLFMGAATFS
ncbi:hypothetical protein NKR23_g2284 [Pleurostoma richardsiae]|uniref:Zn(2)-C6 fungal-type domain-containing protein n=1 Tax=Pleurostoma richardsiae TaxID=41990 RepID=A0AA38VY97_9PEZI|nr:hypothetical protein NKR23_g2284 [Pleurostoma richardsiae]